MALKKGLLFAQEDFLNKYILDGTSVKGSYNTMHFVLRLRKDIRDARFSDFYPERIQADSTVMHENIHWWQHVGSNFGFLFSLSYPAYIHYSWENFLGIIDDGYVYKSLIEFDRQYYEKNGIADISNLNVILNNFYDIEYAKLFALSNSNIVEINNDRRFFLNIGHCYHIFWSSIIHTLSATIDKDYNFLPPTNSWVERFKLLEENKVDGFYVDSPLHLTPIGIKAIYEGQAAFNQAQFLTRALNPSLKYEDFEKSGLIRGIYSEAFECFLKLTTYNKPDSVMDSIVGLFLIVCDISINPNNGFPLNIYDYENFIIKNDPGIRFTLICHQISKKTEYYRSIINQYSKEEYISISKELSEHIGCISPYESIVDVLDWGNQKSIKDILHEEQTEDFSLENLPIRLMFSKYFRFQEDKLKHPNILCWIGFYLSSREAEFEIANSLYEKHHALFMDDDDGEIKATIFKGKSEEKILKSFNNFYAFNILYDLAMKWVNEDGEFKFDYEWLAGARSDTFIPKIKENFKKQFGINIEDIKSI